MTDLEQFLLDELVRTWRAFDACRKSLLLADTDSDVYKNGLTAFRTAHP